MSNATLDISNLASTGAWPPPPGVTPNFIDPPSIAGQVAPIRLAFTAAATFFVVLRIYTRGVLINSLGIDDGFVVISLVISWGFTAFGIFAIPYGYGIDLWNLYIPEVIMFLKIDLGGQLTYFLATMFVKLSIILMYLRLNPDPTFRKIAYTIGAFDITYCLLSCGISAFGCSPVRASWDFTVPHSCVNKKTYFYAQANFNILSDFATLLLPVRMCLKLRLPARQRWMLVLLFAVGSFACVVSIVRLVTLIPSLHSMNFTKFKVQVGTWAAVELNTSIICACLTCLKPLLKRLFPAYMSSPSPTNSDGHSRSFSNSNPRDNSVILPSPTQSSSPASKKTSNTTTTCSADSVSDSWKDSHKFPGFPSFPMRSLSLKRGIQDDGLESAIDRNLEAASIRAESRVWGDSKMGWESHVAVGELHGSMRGSEDGGNESVRGILTSVSSLSGKESLSRSRDEKKTEHILGGDGLAKGVEVYPGGVLKTVAYDVRFGD